MNQFANQAVEQQLGIEIRPEHANMLVGCPEGHSEQQMTLAEFAKTERGKTYLPDALPDMVENYDDFKASGKPEEEALRRAFGSIAIKDKDRNVIMADAEAAKKK